MATASTGLHEGPQQFNALAHAVISAVIKESAEQFEDLGMSQELRIMQDQWVQRLKAQVAEGPRLAAVHTTVPSLLPPGAPVDDSLEEAPPEAPVDTALHRSGILPRIDSVNANGQFGSEIALAALASRLWNVTYESPRAKWLRIDMLRPKATIQLYASGKVVITGAASEEGTHQAGRRLERVLRKAGLSDLKDAKLGSVNVTNIFATASLPFDVRLVQLSAALGLGFNPERAPKLHWRLDSPPATLEISSKGNVGISGVTGWQDLVTAFEQAYPKLKEFSSPRSQLATGPLSAPGASGWEPGHPTAP